MATNRLAAESSLYLRQHADNPIDWYPWAPEALDRARRLDRPIFVSVGYSACHWCHVMAHESFEDDEIAAILNEHFVSIKIDREERPDLDQIYMNAVQMLNRGQGGWPMTVFLTPALQPFFAGTYFPPVTNYGRPSFRQVLHAVVGAWNDRRQDVIATSDAITHELQKLETGAAEPGELSDQLLRAAVEMQRRATDPVHGGLGRAPKFPRPIDLRLLMRASKRFQTPDLLDIARLTLDKMARGGIYDHLGGGFHRYSTDERWLVPHFEKMLYDNALLPPAYLDAWQLTGDPAYRQIVVETLDYVLKEMTAPNGAFYSTQDADSEGEEGKFFVWSEAEIREILGNDLAEIFCYAYDVSATGNWEGHNILHRPKTPEQVATLLRISADELHRKLAEGKSKLYSARDQRVWPGRDEKILTAWNALMISAFAQAGAILGEPRFIAAAVRAGDFVLTNLRASSGRLLRTCGVDQPAKLNGYLDDYAYLAEAMVYLYEATFETRWTTAALELVDIMGEQFFDKTNPGFFFTSADHEALLTRPRDVSDSSTPSGTGVAVLTLLRLAALTGLDSLRKMAVDVLTANAHAMKDSPLSMGQMLLALDFHLGPVDEVAVIGHDAEVIAKATAILRERFQPHQVLAANTGDADPGPIALLRDKQALGAVATYFCRNRTCQAPIVGTAALESFVHQSRDSN